MKLDTNTLEYIGVIGVDSGTVCIGDTVYMKDYSEDDFINILENFENGINKIPFFEGNAGKAIIISQFGGDGTYDVYVNRNDKGLIKQIVINFEK